MNLRSLFKRKKKKKEKETTIFGEPIKEDKKESSRGNFKKDLKQVFAGLKPKRKIKIKFLLKIKRTLAGLLFILYSVSSLMLIPEPYALLFISTAFILLDYLWKTKRSKWTIVEAEKK